jgi:thiosulfate reductase cytochrome b subunit
MLRHPVGVRLAHWVNAVSLAGLVISGVAILLAHPRLYWGETGTLGVPSLVDLPLPFVFGHSGWGRSLHFLAAWVCVLNGVAYVAVGLRRRRFAAGFRVYHPSQRAAYLAVVFVVFPLMIWTGLAMSPAVTSTAPAIVWLLGGQQSARTLHFFAASAVLLFSIGHTVMVYRTRDTR